MNEFYKPLIDFMNNFTCLKKEILQNILTIITDKLI